MLRATLDHRIWQFLASKILRMVMQVNVADLGILVTNLKLTVVEMLN